MSGGPVIEANLYGITADGYVGWIAPNGADSAYPYSLYVLPEADGVVMFEPIVIGDDMLVYTTDGEPVVNFLVTFLSRLLAHGVTAMVLGVPRPGGFQVPATNYACWFDLTGELLDVFDVVAKEMNVDGPLRDIIFYRLFHYRYDMSAAVRQ